MNLLQIHRFDQWSSLFLQKSMIILEVESLSLSSKSSFSSKSTWFWQSHFWWKMDLNPSKMDLWSILQLLIQSHRNHDLDRSTLTLIKLFDHWSKFDSLIFFFKIINLTHFHQKVRVYQTLINNVNSDQSLQNQVSFTSTWLSSLKSSVAVEIINNPSILTSLHFFNSYLLFEEIEYFWGFWWSLMKSSLSSKRWSELKILHFHSKNELWRSERPIIKESLFHTLNAQTFNLSLFELWLKVWSFLVQVPLLTPFLKS